MKVFTSCSLVLSNQLRQLVPHQLKDSAISEFELLSGDICAGGGGGSSAVLVACRLHQQETGSAPERWTLHQCQTIKKTAFAPPAEVVHHQEQMLMMMENSLGATIPRRRSPSCYVTILVRTFHCQFWFFLKEKLNFCFSAPQQTLHRSFYFAIVDHLWKIWVIHRVPLALQPSNFIFLIFSFFATQSSLKFSPPVPVVPLFKVC